MQREADAIITTEGWYVCGACGRRAYPTTRKGIVWCPWEDRNRKEAR